MHLRLGVWREGQKPLSLLLLLTLWGSPSPAQVWVPGTAGVLEAAIIALMITIMWHLVCGHIPNTCASLCGVWGRG